MPAIGLKRQCLLHKLAIAALNLSHREQLCTGVNVSHIKTKKLNLFAYGVMYHLKLSLYSIILFFLLTGCMSDTVRISSEKKSLHQLQQRVSQLEKTIKEYAPLSSTNNNKVPSGPLQSLTLRIGTNDDRLRIYWANDQLSDLICTKEGKGVWACG